ncbi:MAG: hypothetical protein KIT31_11605 [Deltaproteobacteria bacterium]|nr:hypothetical protein [Deltaproteobacteria bacterium]
MKTAILTAMTVSVLTACTGGNDNIYCEDGKCDTPGGTLEEQCANSRVNAMDERRPHFNELGVRWSCKDVNGVTADSNTKDDRGQEYCEYFTMLHTNGVPEVIMNEQGPVFCDAGTPCATGVCDNNIFSCVTSSRVDTSSAADILGKNVRGSTVTPLDPVLTAGQLEWLGQNGDAKVGECVFTSWHKDITRMPTSGNSIGGYPLTAKTPNSSNPLFRMEVGFNSNDAAKALVADCLVAGDEDIKDPFTRACTFCGSASCVPWRKSDPSVCAMAMRVAECGCSVEVDGRALDLSKESDLEKAKDLFVPAARRGFAIGTWDSPSALPTGCRYVKTGDSTSITVAGKTVVDPMADQNIVACDLKASHITAATAKDPKEACRQAYGDEVVVHVRAPNPDMATLSCSNPDPACQVPWDIAPKK